MKGALRRRRWGHRRAQVALWVFGLTCIALWIVSIARAAAGATAIQGAPTEMALSVSWPAQLAILAALVTLAVWLVARLSAAVGAGGARRRRALALTAMTLLALAVRVTGIDHELVDRPYLDEGTYWHHAQQINGGEPWSASFVYPHLVYYVDAFTLWAAEPFRPALVRAVAALLGADHPAATDPIALDWLLLRLLVALAGALTVWPVFRVAEIVAGEPGGRGLAAGVMGGLFIAFAPLYNEVSHLNISDLPSAYFAALCLAAAAKLLQGESLAGYLAAGAAAGLAASCKYPAGVVAVAVAAVWLHHRLRRWKEGRQRRGEPAAAADEESAVRAPAPRRIAAWLGSAAGLGTAGLAALAVFIAATPSLLLYPRQALTGGRGIFFGVRQYAGGGWIGVQPDSNVLYYARLAVGEVGAIAAAVALVGLIASFFSPVGRRLLARLAWLAPFPVAYLLLVSGMNMVVRRNLLPAVPPLAAFTGVGVVAAWAAAMELVGRRRSRSASGARSETAPKARGGLGGGRWLAPAAVALLAVLILLPPASRSLTASVAMARPSTRELARAWLVENAPPGSAVLRESYGPELPPERFAVWKSRFAARFPLADLRAGKVDYLVLASAAYGRFLDPEQHSREHHATYGAWYREVFADLPLAARIVPGRFTWGPVVRIHRLPAVQPSAGALTLPASGFFVPDGGMRPAGGKGAAVRWFRPGQWSLAKADLVAGAWRLELEGEVATVESGTDLGSPGEGRVPRGRLLLDGAPLATVPLEGVGWRHASFVTPEAGRVYVYLELPLGSKITGLRLRPQR